MEIKIKLEQLLSKYETELEKLHSDWQYGNLGFDIYRMDIQYIKGKIAAIIEALKIIGE